MKLTMVVSLLVAVAAALPAAAPVAEPLDALPLEKRQGCSPCVNHVMNCCSAPYCFVYKC